MTYKVRQLAPDLPNTALIPDLLPESQRGTASSLKAVFVF